MRKKHQIAMALRSTCLCMHRKTNASLAPLNITADQYVCLILLEKEDGITLQELVIRATSDPNTIRAMLVLVKKRGLITRGNHPNDGRARFVHLTEKGRDLLRQSAPAIKPLQDGLMAPFCEKDAGTLISNLKRILGSMTQ
ncbi:MarR family transcriptional regulator [bacterium]|nr:MarR family transcriptional regulator [bacterium]